MGTFGAQSQARSAVRGRWRVSMGLASVTAMALLLAGCVTTGPGFGETSRTPGTAASGSSTASPEPDGEGTPPALNPEAAAEENLAYFTQVVSQVWASEQRGTSLAYVEALTAAGFDRTAMQITADTTTVGNPAESIEMSVRWGEAECLVGQVGPSIGEVVTKVMPQLAEGRCLVGATISIDG